MFIRIRSVEQTEQVFKGNLILYEQASNLQTANFFLDRSDCELRNDYLIYMNIFFTRRYHIKTRHYCPLSIFRPTLAEWTFTAPITFGNTDELFDK